MVLGDEDMDKFLACRRLLIYIGKFIYRDNIPGEKFTRLNKHASHLFKREPSDFFVSLYGDKETKGQKKALDKN